METIKIMNDNILNLLLVEDNEGDANLILSFLEESNNIEFTVDWKRNICEFSIDGSDQSYDVILLDLSLPNFSGIEAFSMMHKNFPDIPIIVLTSVINEDEAIKTLQQGAQDVISKDHLTTFLLNRAIKHSIERKQMEQEIIRTQKLETIGILAGGIAHDFNNILTSILGNISLVKMEISPEDQPDVHEILGEAETASLRAKDLANQLLTFSKGGAPVKKLTNLFVLIHDSATFALRGSNVRCNLDVDPEMWEVNVDPNQIHQVLNNIIINADQAMPKGGEITIHVKNISTKRNYFPSNVSERAYIEISIQDDGIGITTENLSRIFDPYFTYGKVNGSGLGLTTSYSIIKRHEGYMWVDSELGVGTTVFILLPAHPKPFSPQLAKTSSHEGKKEKYKVLIMDDEIGVRTILAKMLRRLNYSVVETANGTESIAAYEDALSTSHPVDLLIMDLTIPGGMGGEKAINILHKKYPDIKAIVSSGYSNDPIMAEYAKFGFIGVLMKPFTIKNLKYTLANVLNLKVE
ncbi:Sensor histidine kinase RcsC [Candidatus Lokiarchaeum ossiferum]